MALPAAVRCCLVLLLAWPLVACSGTPFGDQLGDSFSEPAGPAEPAPAGSAAPAAPEAPEVDQAPSPGAPGTPASTPVSPVRPTPAAAEQAPAPYRLTLRLPAADPAAPAEAVTQALRAAGLAFEVEMIERVPS
ncbi:MAG: hypothetical protein ACNA8O_15575, partial [Cyanobacteriota bacterium]